MRPSHQVGSDIRQITDIIVEQSDVGTLTCSIDGTASGIPGAFTDALDRADVSGHSSGRLHELLVEYAECIGFERNMEIPRFVILTFNSGKTNLTTR